MGQISRLLSDATNYPRNLARSNTIDDSLESYFNKINQHQHSIFTSEEKADLGVCELSINGEGSSTQKPATLF